MPSIQDLIDKYTQKRLNVINPDRLSWEDLGDGDKGPIEGYTSLEDALIDNGELDEGQQTEISMCEEILEDLEALKADMEKMGKTPSTKKRKRTKTKGEQDA